jgi:enolase
MDFRIKQISAREILDSRGFPTVEAEVEAGGERVTASVPSGTSTGKYEALELRDGGERYQGRGVLRAVGNVNDIISPALLGKDVSNQRETDKLLISLDGTDNKSRLGANAIAAVSLACCRMGAVLQKKPLWKWISEISGMGESLPSPCILFIEGGLHGKGWLDIQEIMVLLEAGSYKEKLRVSTEIYHSLGKLLTEKYGKASSAVGLEGAFIPAISETEEAIEAVLKAIKDSGYQKEIRIILDMAASSFYKDGKYFFEGDILKKEDLEKYYLDLCQKYPIFAIEDPFAEEDWESFSSLTSKVGPKVTIIGDDLLVTNTKRIETAAEKKACNGLILKPNQIGTVSESITAAKYALSNGWKVFVKHRSGETKDDFIADLATGLGTGYLMAGAPSRGERVAKYNRLLKIEEELKQ